MPAKYEAMRDKFAKTMSLRGAKRKAAKIYNAQRKPGETPVTPASRHREKRMLKGAGGY